MGSNKPIRCYDCGGEALYLEEGSLDLFACEECAELKRENGLVMVSLEPDYS